MINSPGFLFWRRPTLARPFAVLPSGLQRFTSVFGMGTGGATTLMSPERRSACAARLWCAARDCVESLVWGASHSEAAIVDSRFNRAHDSDFQRATDPLTSTYRKKNVIRDSLHCYIGFSDSRFNVSTIHGTSRASFCFEIFPLLCLPLRKSAERLNRKVKDQAERVISTPELNTLLCLYPEPINVVVYHDPSGRSHLGIGLALRCFQRLSFPNIATQRCR